MALPKIGTTAYAVYKTFRDEKLENGEIIVCRVKSYRNLGGKIVPVLKEVGGRRNVNCDNYYVYTKLAPAIEAITTEPKKKR